MFKETIEQCFAPLKTIDPSVAKEKFGYIWYAFADKIVRFRNYEIDLSWRDASRELAKVFNAWYDASFTTDAFYYCVQQAHYGLNAHYTEIVDMLRAHPDFVGIFEIETTPFSNKHPTVLIREHDIVTGKNRYIKHEVKSKLNHQKTEITEQEYRVLMEGK